MSDSQPIPQVFPHDFDSYHAFANRVLDRFYNTQSLEDLFTAVLLCSHIVDWYCVHVIGKEYRGQEAIRREMTKNLPTWKVLCDLTNGAKHARIKENEAHPGKLKSEAVEWEDSDAWDHLGMDDHYWTVEFEGEQRSIYTLCKQLLSDSARWLAQGKSESNRLSPSK